MIKGIAANAFLFLIVTGAHRCPGIMYKVINIFQAVTKHNKRVT